MFRRILLPSLLLLALAGCEDLVDQTGDQPENTPSGPFYPSMRGRPFPAQDPLLQSTRYDPAFSSPGERYRNGGDVDRGEPPLK